MKDLLQPQEIEVFYIIPALKKYLATEMKSKGLKQKEIAKLFSTKDATISQYLNNKRGNKLEFDEIMLVEIKKSAKSITDNLTYMKEMQHLLRKVKETNELCRIHKALSKIPGHCTPDLISCY
tara:strand:- start:577 stop:945 length:369 start_codon:yes stop_codon:yes gene_type:complete